MIRLHAFVANDLNTVLCSVEETPVEPDPMLYDVRSNHLQTLLQAASLIRPWSIYLPTLYIVIWYRHIIL